MNLDKFLEKKNTKLNFTVNDKTYIADVSSLAMLRISTLAQDLPLADMVEKMFEIIFGKTEAKELFNSLNKEGIVAIQNEISKYFIDEEANESGK